VAGSLEQKEIDLLITVPDAWLAHHIRFEVLGEQRLAP
jgi:hypothetical protein